MCFDTGSGSLWVPSTSCTGQACAQRAKFNPAASSTFSSNGNPFTMNYGIGEAQGEIATDVVSLGPLAGDQRVYAKEGDLVVKHQEFMLANVLSGGTFTQTLFDGVMGLSQGGKVGTPFYINLRDQGSLEHPWVSLYYSNTDSQPGKIIFGGVSNELYTGSFTWHPPGPTFPFYWTTLIHKIDIGSRTVWTCPNDSCEAMIDSGTSLVIAPNNWISTADAQEFTVPSDCSGLASHPTFTVYLKDVDGNLVAYPLPASEYTLQREGTCTTGLTVQGSAQTDNMIILGDVFIRYYYTIFDFSAGSTGGRIGFAQAVH